jgi:RNase P protein component
MKRLLREAFWSAAGDVPAGHDFVLVARPDAAELAERGAPAVAEALRELLDQAGLLGGNGAG